MRTRRRRGRRYDDPEGRGDIVDEERIGLFIMGERKNARVDSCWHGASRQALSSGLPSSARSGPGGDAAVNSTVCGD